MNLFGDEPGTTWNKGFGMESAYQGQEGPARMQKVPAEALIDGIEHYRVLTAERELLENTLNGSVQVLTEILSLSDPVSFGRGQTVRDQARQVAQLLQLNSTWELDLAAMLCPIGCVSLPPELNQKAKSGLTLTGAEKDALARVPQVGHDLLNKIPRLEAVARIVLYQHKNFDGTGFPSDAVKGEEIPLEARILRALTDLAQLEAKNIPRFKALEQLQQQPDVYDLKVVDTMARSFELTSATRPDAVEEKPVALDFPDLRVGHVLSGDIVTKQDILIVVAGTKMTPLILERLRNFASLSGLKLPIYVQG